MISKEFRQEHFEIYEIVLPWVRFGTAKDPDVGFWNTPLTANEPSNDEYSLFFAKNSLPIGVPQPRKAIEGTSVLNGSIFRCVTSASENTCQLKGEGLASRGTMSLTCQDFKGDSGPKKFTNNGTFFGKLLARNVLQGKKIITHYYSIVGFSGSERLQKVSQSVHFITSVQLQNGQFKISAKDALKDAEKFSEKFPSPSEMSLTQDIDETQITFSTTGFGVLKPDSFFRIGSEIFRVNTVSGDSVTVFERGRQLNVMDDIVYKTDTESHSAGDTIQLCYVSPKLPVWEVMLDVFKSVGLDKYADVAQWQTEISEWLPNALVIGVFSKPESINTLIDNMLKSYMLSMWFDQGSQKVKISAASAWRYSTRALKEGDDFQDISVVQDDNERFSRAFMLCNKPYQARSDDEIEYLKTIYSTDISSETSDMYGSSKLKEFGMVQYISQSSAQITTSRYIQRYSSPPKTLSFSMEERKIFDMAVGSVVDISSRETQDASGEYRKKITRAQITKIQPNFSKIGRFYNVTALSYLPLIEVNENDTINLQISGSARSIDLFARAGAPNVRVDVILVLDGAEIGSDSVSIPSIRAGMFRAGSTIKIICINSVKWGARGGNSSSVRLDGRNIITDIQAENGGICYQSDGIKTDIYLNYNYDKYKCSGELRAPNGGGASGFGYSFLWDSDGNKTKQWSYVAFGGGSGIPSGDAGSVVSDIETVIAEEGDFYSQGKNIVSNKGRVNFGENFTETTARASGLSSITSATLGGYSVNFDGSWSVSTGTRSSMAQGSAIKGGSVTIYNNVNNKLVKGNSDNFTLIEV